MARQAKKRQNPSKTRKEPHFEEKGGLTANAKDRLDKKAGASRKKRKPRAKKHGVLWRIFAFLIRPLPRMTYWGAVVGLWGMIGVAGIFAFYAAQLPSAKNWVIPERPPNVRIVADNNDLIANRGVTGGKALRLEDMSPYIPQAVIAIEDRRFHAHFGFDPIGFARAMTRNIMQKRLREGGSTITQQLAKNLFLKPERTFGRKVQELILAIWLEAKYTKAEILELYLNRVYFGAGATGVDAASRRYFGKTARHVSLDEAALLAGLLKAPSRYTPARNPKLAQKRARLVLRAMQREGYVKAGKIDLQNLKPGEHARHFRSGPEHFVSDMIMKEVSLLLGDVQQDIIVETTVSPYLMTAAHEILSASLNTHGKKRRVSQSALVSMAPDGAIKALIGGRNYGKSQFNRAVEAKRQPGSAFKTFVWLNALQNGESPESIRIDAPVRVGKWRPENYDQRYRGPVTLDDAFAQSLNTIAATLVVEGGTRNVAATAHSMGIKSKLTANASLALGTSEVSLLELTSAYAPLANGGLQVRPWLIKRITTAHPNKGGKVLYQRKVKAPHQVVASRELGMMNAMLSSVLTNGTGKAARLAGHQAGGKTGTSQNFRDALFVGHTAHLVTGVWFGNDNNSPTKKLTGGSLPARAWKEFMQVAHRDLQPKPLPGAVHIVGRLPEKIPVPKSRPDRFADGSRPVPPIGVGDETTGSIRELLKRNSADEVAQVRGRKSILDLILGN